jgi:CO dehydrogenase/acetyl-CoA synthase beta subunit
MNVLDEGIRGITEWFRKKNEEGKTVRFYGPTKPQSEAPASSDPKPANTNQSIIFKEDTHIELGHPSAGSCSAVLATEDSSLVEDGRVTLVGPDINETNEQVLPFAQIAVACCDGDIEDTCSAMDRVLHVSAQTDGYMLRSVPDLIWARVSKDAAQSGFSMRELGLRLVDALHQQCTGINKVEIFLVTSSKEDVREVDGIVGPARDRLRKLQTFERQDDGTYECESSLDCTECPEKPVCDTVREVITIRKGDRIITLGGDDADGMG